MAEFQAKKLNANEINNGQKWEYGQSPSTETFNAPIEGCLYLQERSIKTEKELQNIKAVLLGNNQYVEIKTEDAYKSRITANGANIFDDQFARVKKIQGDTVKSKNIFNRYYGTPTGGSYITETTDEKIIVRQQRDGITYVSANIPLENPEQYVGKTLYISAKWTCSSANKGGIRVMWLNESTGIAGGQVNESGTSGAVVSGIVPERPANATGLYVMLYSNVDGTAVQGDTVTYTDIMVSTENVPYTPYFTGLKHAYIDSIKSTCRNIIDYKDIFSGLTDYSIAGEEVTVNKTIYGYGMCSSKLFYLPIGNYTISAYVKSNIDYFRAAIFCVRDINNKDVRSWLYTTITSDYSRISTTFSITKAGFYKTQIQMHGNADYPMASMSFKNVQIALTDTTATDYEPYIETEYKLPVPVELPEYDSVLPQEGKIIRATDTVTINGTTAKVAKSVDLGDWQLYTYTPNSNLSCVYGSQIVPIGWGIDTPANSVGFSKGVYLTNTNYVTIGVWFHKVDFLAQTGVDTSNATAINEYLSNNPLIIERQLQNPNTLPLECPQYYTAWNNGTETVIQGETDNSQYGAMPTITQFYLGKVVE